MERAANNPACKRGLAFQRRCLRAHKLVCHTSKMRLTPFSGWAKPLRGSYVSGCTQSNSRRPPRPIRAWVRSERSPSGSPEPGSMSQPCCGRSVHIMGSAYGSGGGDSAARFCTYHFSHQPHVMLHISQDSQCMRRGSSQMCPASAEHAQRCLHCDAAACVLAHAGRHAHVYAAARKAPTWPLRLASRLRFFMRRTGSAVAARADAAAAAEALSVAPPPMLLPSPACTHWACCGTW